MKLVKEYKPKLNALSSALLAFRLNGLLKFGFRQIVMWMMLISAMTLSACSTLGPKVNASENSQPLPPPVTYPSSALPKCPETLPGTDIGEDDWYKLSLKEQVVVLTRHAGGFAIGYFRCAIRHNTGSDAYTDAVKARNQWQEDQKPKPEPEKKKSFGVF